ncbi:MAG: hypothetical protein ACRYGM_27180 [Janthinobacterium lividum]
MLKLLLLSGMALLMATGGAHAACTPDDVMAKSSDVSEALMEKIQAKPDQGAKLMNELGEITSVSPPTAQTCTRLDDLLKRAKAL